MAQTDVIYLEENNDSIVDCQIIKIENEIVFFTKDFKIKSIAAVGVLKSGTYIDLSNDSNAFSYNKQSQSVLYRGKAFQYYENKYLTAKSRVRGGIALSILGFAGQVAGISMINMNTNSVDGTGAFLIIGGGILFDIGMPLWISNVIIMNNNKKAMNSTKATVDLSFGPTSNGIGLRLNF